MRFAILCSVLLLASCGKPEAIPETSETVTYRYLNHSTRVFIDKDTGCQYFIGGYGIKTPRYDSTGEKVLGCKNQKDPGT